MTGQQFTIRSRIVIATAAGTAFGVLSYFFVIGPHQSVGEAVVFGAGFGILQFLHYTWLHGRSVR